MAMGMGSGGAPGGGGDLNALANLAAVFSDPAALKQRIDDFKVREAAAVAAEEKAQKVIDASIASSKALDERKAKLDTDAAKLTDDVKNNVAWGARLDARRKNLDEREKAMAMAVAKLNTDTDAANAILAATAKDNDLCIANANAALDKRASDVKAREDAVAAAQSKLDDMKAALDARAARIAQAVA